MQKAYSLHRAVLDSVPELAHNPDRLMMYVDKGGVAVRPQRMGFVYRYTVRLVVVDFIGHVDALLVPVLAWASVNEPVLFQSPEQQASGLGFEADVTGQGMVDIEITLELSESVAVAAAGEGEAVATHHPEPACDFDEPNGWEAWAKGVRVVSC